MSPATKRRFIMPFKNFAWRRKAAKRIKKSFGDVHGFRKDRHDKLIILDRENKSGEYDKEILELKGIIGALDWVMEDNS